MNNFVGLSKQVFSGIRAESIYTQISASIQKEMDQPFQMPNNLYEFGNANQCMPFDDVRRIFAMYEQALRLKDNLIANLLEKNRQLEQEKQRLQLDTQRIPLLEEHIKFLEQHPTTTNIYNAPHYQADKIEKHTDIEVGSQNISNGGVGVNYSKPTPTTMPPTPDTHSNKTATAPESYSIPEESYTPLTFDQRVQRESTPIQVFYEKVSLRGFFAMPVITCLTDDSKILLLYEITKQSNTPFATAMIHYLQYYEHCHNQYEEFSKNSFYNHIAAALNNTVSAETIKKNFMSIDNSADYLRDKYSAWQLRSNVEAFYNQLEKN